MKGRQCSQRPVWHVNNTGKKEFAPFLDLRIARLDARMV
jgi:hypothetical protein